MDGVVGGDMVIKWRMVGRIGNEMSDLVDVVWEMESSDVQDARSRRSKWGENPDGRCFWRC
ncbi:hypothetical protein, partial [Bacillus safensis]|uniref:hypothetical protein n=1 Tax=Bacillus safensis TaxID=561879 RepID=UPI001C92FD8B